MGLIAKAAQRLVAPPVPMSPTFSGVSTPFGGTPQSYPQLARRGYAGNEIVFAAIELIATSASEPHIVGRRWRRASPQLQPGSREALRVQDEIHWETGRLLAKGHSYAEVNAALIRNGFITQVPDHPLVRILNNPNPFVSRGQLWSTITMDHRLAGNAYLLKARYQGGPLEGAVGELWRLRPDRVRIIPDRQKVIAGYEYGFGGDKVILPPEDVIHFKTRNPFDDYYGMPPLLPIMGRLDIDAYMQGFLKTFFEHGQTGPGSILTVKTKLGDDAKTEIRERMQRQFGPGNWLGTMIIDNNETTYQQMGLNRGLRDALPKEIDAQTEARIAMVFGIPGSILGLLIGYESSSYANKRADREVFWKITMAPLLSDLDDALNLSLVREFGGIDEVMFDLSDIEALQEEVDKRVGRWLKVLGGGGCSLEEFRDAVGLDPENLDGTFLIPANILPTHGDALGEGVSTDGAMAALLRTALIPQTVNAPAMLEEARCPNCHRLLGRDVSGARFDCPRCKTPVLVDNGVLTT